MLRLLIFSSAFCMAGALKAASITLTISATFASPDGSAIFTGGISDNGKVAFSTVGSGSGIPYIREADGTIVREPIFSGSRGTALVGINNSGVAVGYFTSGPNSNCNANCAVTFSESNATYTQLDTGPSAGQGINNNGSVIGSLSSAVNFPGAFNTQARGLNDSGAIVGIYSPTPNTFRAFLFQQGAFTDITGIVPQSFVVGGIPYVDGILNNGDIYGARGWIFDPSTGQTTLIITPPGVLIGKINNSGQVFGFNNTQELGFIGILTPEPSSLVLTGICLVAFCLRNARSGWQRSPLSR